MQMAAACNVSPPESPSADVPVEIALTPHGGGHFARGAGRGFAGKGLNRHQVWPPAKSLSASLRDPNRETRSLPPNQKYRPYQLQPAVSRRTKMKVPRILLIAVFVSWALSPSGRWLKAQEHAAHYHRYKFIDLGTLGGPHSYGSPNGLGSRLLNSAGVVASSADTTAEHPDAPGFCGVPDLLGCACFPMEPWGNDRSGCSG
jgi:hypothetical protein